jgi:hypothetical protein
MINPINVSKVCLLYYKSNTCQLAIAIFFKIIDQFRCLIDLA